MTHLLLEAGPDSAEWGSGATGGCPRCPGTSSALTPPNLPLHGLNLSWSLRWSAELLGETQELRRSGPGPGSASLGSGSGSGPWLVHSQTSTEVSLRLSCVLRGVVLLWTLLWTFRPGFLVLESRRDVVGTGSSCLVLSLGSGCP